MRRIERWTTEQAWSPVLAAEARADIAERARKWAHYEFLWHPEAPAPEHVIWPSVVTREFREDGRMFYRVTGKAYR